MSQTTAQLVSGTSAQAVTFGDTTVASINGGSIAGNRNRIINGDMRIDQRNSGASVTPGNNTYALDRWRQNSTQASKYSCQQNAGSVTPPSGFSQYMGITSLSAYSVTSGDAFWVDQLIEGFNVSDLAWGTANAKPITLSFWVRSSLTGTFGGSFRNGSAARTYPYSYTISVANTWEQKVISIQGDTSGTWATDNSIGVYVGFNLGSGSTYIGTAGAWAAANYISATGATSVVGTSGATFYITGVQLEPGTVATPFERRSYGAELVLCQRYYYEDAALIATGLSGTSLARATASHPVEMRAAPSVTVSNSVQFFSGSATATATGGGVTNYSTVRHLNFDLAVGSNGVLYAAHCRIAGSGKITVGAEL